MKIKCYSNSVCNIYVKYKLFPKFGIKWSHFCITKHKITYYKGYLVHREDGPAIEWSDGSKEWIVNGKRHREDGPAILYPGPEKCFFLNNIRYSEEEYWRIINTKKKQQILESIL